MTPPPITHTVVIPPQRTALEAALDDLTVLRACANRANVRDLVAKRGWTAEIEAEARIIGLVIISTGMCHQGPA